MRVWTMGWLAVGLVSCRPTQPTARLGAHADIKVQAQRPERRDVPVTRVGVGYAQGRYTALIRSQVDGTLDDVYFREGQDVAAGDVLAQVDPRPFQIAVAQARATLLRDIAQRDNARVNLRRSDGLLGDKLISAQAVADLAATVGQLEATVAADRASLEAAALQLERATIRAPFAGRLGMRQVDPGNLVKAQDVNGLVVLSSLDPMALVFTLPEDDLPLVVAAMARGPMEVEALAHPDDRVVGQGVVQAIDNQISSATGTLRLKAELKNPDLKLWPNQFLRARLAVGLYRAAQTLPARAITRGPRGDHVWVVDAAQTAVLRHVTVAAVLGDLAVVAEGVADDELVVTDGQFRLVQGSKVQLLAPQPQQPPEGQPQP